MRVRLSQSKSALRMKVASLGEKILVVTLLTLFCLRFVIRRNGLSSISAEIDVTGPNFLR